MYKDVLIELKAGLKGFLIDIRANELQEFLKYNENDKPVGLTNGIDFIYPNGITNIEPTIAYLRCSDYAWKKLKVGVWENETLLINCPRGENIYSLVRADPEIKAIVRVYLAKDVEVPVLDTEGIPTGAVTITEDIQTFGKYFDIL